MRRGSWDLVTRILVNVAGLIMTYNPQLWYLEPYLLKGSWDLVTTVIVKVTILITPIEVLRTSLTKSHDPPSGVDPEHPGTWSKYRSASP